MILLCIEYIYTVPHFISLVFFLIDLSLLIFPVLHHFLVSLDILYDFNRPAHLYHLLIF